ncbi:MAG TPA: FAD-binding oxidoreductase [Paracoccaceae bacterium]|nr:FAD-binding oxidoreductase [Paracoccaceae bacterium]
MRILIIGGGIMGASLAWWLTRGEKPPEVTVLERDLTLAKSSTMLSAASIRQQFSTPENIRLSRFGWDFLMRAGETLGEDVSLRRRGYLVLAGPEGAEALRQNVAVQQAEGAATALLAPGEIAARFPWLSVEGIALGALGRDEGWFDPAALHRGLMRGAKARGAAWMEGEAVGIPVRAGRVQGVRLASGETLPAEVVVNAAGARAGEVAAMAGQHLPVRPDIRTVFHLTSPDANAIRDSGPLLVDPSGFWMRPEGQGFLAGMESAGQPEDPWSLPIDWPLFDESLWPLLAARVPHFERLRVAGAWAGPYDWNDWDQNALLGADPACPNLFHVAGFSGHGLQQAPCIGRAMAELILTGAWRAIELSAFEVTRIARGRRVVERRVI